MSENEDINNFTSTLSKVQIQMIVDTLINNYFGGLLVKLTLEKTAKFADAIRSEQIRVWLSTLTERQLWRLAANMEKQKINSFVQTLTHEQLGRFMLNITAEQMLWVVWYLDNEQLDRVPII